MDPDAPVHYAKVYFPLSFFIPRGYSFYLNYFKFKVLVLQVGPALHQVDTGDFFFLLLQFCGFLLK
jgi:hypothetical protein